MVVGVAVRLGVDSAVAAVADSSIQKSAEFQDHKSGLLMSKPFVVTETTHAVDATLPVCDAVAKRRELF